MVRLASGNTTARKTQSVARRSAPGAKRRLPFSSAISPVTDNGRLRSASLATMATPQQLQGKSRNGGRLFDTSFEASDPMNSSFDSESTVLNSSRASVVSQVTAEKRDVAKTWLSGACEAGAGFLYSDEIYERYQKNICSPELLLPADTSCGFFATFTKLFPFVERKRLQVRGSRSWGYRGIRWRSEVVPDEAQSPKEPIVVTAADDSVSIFSPSEADTLTSTLRTVGDFDFRKPINIDYMKFHPKVPIPKEIVEQRNALPPYCLKPLYKQSPAERRTLDAARDALRHSRCGICGKFEGSELLVRVHQANTFDCSGYGLTCRLCNQLQRNKNELKLHILSCDGQQRQFSPGVEDDLRDHPSRASVALSRATSDPHLPFRPTETMKRLYSQNFDNAHRAATKRLHSQGLKAEWFNLPPSSMPVPQIIPQPHIEEKEKQAERNKPPSARLIKLTKEQKSYPQNGHEPAAFDVPRLDNIGQCSQINVDEFVNEFVSSLPAFTPDPFVSFTRKKKKKRNTAVSGSKNTLLKPATTPEIMALYGE